LILTILESRIAHPEPGQYWIATVDGGVRGVAVQSPIGFIATLTPMPPEAVIAVVDAIVDQGAELPGVNGEAATAARFAGHWTERTRSSARPVEGMRMYEAIEVVNPGLVNGHLRAASEQDREQLTTWFEAFAVETDSPGSHGAAEVVDRRLAAGEVSIWDDGGSVAMAGLSQPVAGVVRVGPVYTPPAQRKRGYAAGLVATLSGQALATECRCILYTALANPTANSGYRSIGYRAIDEALLYHFDP
jgi:predicted GNAT family acetyltransferase